MRGKKHAVKKSPVWRAQAPARTPSGRAKKARAKNFTAPALLCYPARETCRVSCRALYKREAHARQSPELSACRFISVSLSPHRFASCADAPLPAPARCLHAAAPPTATTAFARGQAAASTRRSAPARGAHPSRDV
jgi:hypothetical protein